MRSEAPLTCTLSNVRGATPVVGYKSQRVVNTVNRILWSQSFLNTSGFSFSKLFLLGANRVVNLFTTFPYNRWRAVNQAHLFSRKSIIRQSERTCMGGVHVPHLRPVGLLRNCLMPESSVLQNQRTSAFRCCISV